MQALVQIQYKACISLIASTNYVFHGHTFFFFSFQRQMIILLLQVFPQAIYLRVLSLQLSCMNLTDDTPLWVQKNRFP